MKKFIALVFALIFALSACTVAFATTEWTCPEEGCKAVLGSKALYDAHVNGGCLVKFTDCAYCGAKVDRDDIEAHIANCPKYSETCQYCGEKFDSVAAKAKHKCKIVEVAGGNEDVANIITKVIEAIKSIDWADLANKVVDFVKSINLDEIVGKVKPLFEKVTSLVGELEIPAAK